MGRRELREQIFLLLFRVEFNNPSDMPEQIKMFLEDDEVVRSEKDAEYITGKYDKIMEKLADIFKNKVIPLLQEYFYEDYEKVRLVLADNQKKDERNQFILAKKINQGELFGNADIGLDDGFTYEINEDAFMNPEAYLQI